jgi:hypothetical protein
VVVEVLLLVVAVDEHHVVDAVLVVVEEEHDQAVPTVSVALWFAFCDRPPSYSHKNNTSK